ncbi:MAG: long-chain fatty acid--CoA ligase [Desulfuromonadales bacterium]
MTKTLPQILLDKAARRGDQEALRRKEDGQYAGISWKTLARQVRLCGRGLIHLGIQPEDKVAIMAPNCPEWVYADLGAMACGALSVPVYHTEGIDTVLYILQNSSSRVLFLYSLYIAEELAEKLDEVPHLEKIILIDDELDHPRFTSLASFLQEAEKVPESQLDERLEKGKPDEVATIVYTSGTTGPPKGVLLTHNNFLSNIEECCKRFDISDKDMCLSFLPLSHVFERMAGYYFMLYQGTVIAYAEGIDSVPANLVEVAPTVAISVPRLYEKMFARVMDRVVSGPWLKKQMFFSALNSGRKLVRQQQAGENPSALLRGGVALARKIVFAPIKKHLGGRLRFFVSGGAPLTENVAEFFLAAGIPIYEGYGLTETSPVIACNYPGALRLGTVGRPLDGVEVRLGEDDEILVRGPNVFSGYWNLPEQTREAFSDGWFKTGDIGKLDADGFLAITDRKKDLLVTAGGENVAPQMIEGLFKTDKYLSNAMVYGDRKPYLTALLVPNFENLEKYARYKNIDFLTPCDLVNHPKVLNLIRRRIDRLQENLASFQRVKRFTLLSRDFSKEENEITPTLKIKRKVVAKNFNKILEGMYIAKDKGIHDAGFCIVENLTDAEKDD